MAGNDRRSSTGVDRRTSMRYSAQPQDDDDYDLEAMGISDGFRPMMDNNMSGPSHNRMSSQISQYTPRPKTPPPRPSSTTKPPIGIDSFALRHDGGMGPMGMRSSMAASSSGSASGSGSGPALTRSSSVSTNGTFMRAESPYQGPSGPSHPYQMYPQESRLARTASVATTSTVQVADGPYRGPGGPTHPYGMYPQNTVEPEINETPPVPPVPVGFPGLNNDYQRRLGPDGEEIADIIGPDGHTEQLPPYTQYPDEALARKTRGVVVPPPVGAGGMGLATRNPEFASREDLVSADSRHSSRSEMNMSDAESNHNINMGAAGASEKPALKHWQVVAKRRVFDLVPIWVLVLVAFVIALFCLILGITFGVILKPKHNEKSPQNQHSPYESAQSVEYTTMTTTFDANPLTTLPTGLPTLPTGTYALPISAPSAIQNSCLYNTQQSSAWSCAVPMTQYIVSIASLPGADVLNNNEINLTLGNSTFGGYYPYGTQPPILTSSRDLHLVTDHQEVGRGPAWFFEMTYNKLVIVPEDSLSPTVAARSLESRDSDEHDVGQFQGRKNVAQVGDKPWFCYWNATLLEAFIYVNLSSSAATQTTSSSTTPTPSSSKGYERASATTPSASSQTSNSNGYQQLTWLPAYPKVMKIEERRIPNGIQPVCIQQYINANGKAQVLMNSTNQPTTIYLNETEASSVSQISGKRSTYELRVEDRNSDLARRQTSGNCGCVWLWT